MTQIRRARFLARAGVASRRGAAELVAAGRVRVNGAPPLGPGDPIEPGQDEVTLDGRPLAITPTLWLVLNKPPGYVTSRCGTPRSPSIFALLDAAPDALVAVGRLDVYSEGVLLFTTDGEAANRLMHPRWQVPRTYRVLVTGRVGRAEQAALARGVPLEDGVVRPVSWRFRPDAKGGELELVLGEGRTRVVRRVAARLGLGIRRLVRTAYGPVGLGSLGAGESRTLGAKETGDLYAAIGLAPSHTSSR